MWSDVRGGVPMGLLGEPMGSGLSADPPLNSAPRPPGSKPRMRADTRRGPSPLLLATPPVSKPNPPPTCNTTSGRNCPRVSCRRADARRGPSRLLFASHPGSKLNPAPTCKSGGLCRSARTRARRRRLHRSRDLCNRLYEGRGVRWHALARSAFQSIRKSCGLQSGGVGGRASTIRVRHRVCATPQPPRPPRACAPWQIGQNGPGIMSPTLGSGFLPSAPPHRRVCSLRRRRRSAALVRQQTSSSTMHPLVSLR